MIRPNRWIHQQDVSRLKIIGAVATEMDLFDGCFAKRGKRFAQPALVRYIADGDGSPLLSGKERRAHAAAVDPQAHDRYMLPGEC